MNNYYIDASIYANPLQKNIEEKGINTEILDEYFDRIRALYEIIIYNQPRHIKYFLADRDFEFLRTCNLDLLQIDISKLSLDKYYLSNLGLAQDLLNAIYKKLCNALIHIEFNKWFRILDLEFNSEPILSDDISMYIRNDELRNNTIKNIAIIAALNEYVYKNSKTHKIILSNDINLDCVQITADLSIDMDFSPGRDKNNNKVIYKCKIKNFPNNDILQIKNQNVEISKLNALTESNYIYSWNMDHNTFLDKVKKEFAYIEFGLGCAKGMEQYRRKINIKQQEILKKNKMIISKDFKDIEQWKNQFYDVLYANLEALNDFLSNNNIAGIKKDDECYHGCEDGCDKIQYCGAHIRYFGADCVDETREDKKNRYVKLGRTFDNSIYWLHLRPYTMSCDATLWFLCMRIHFRWIETNKIEIGWIGMHLFAPCRKRDPVNGTVKNCIRLECPRYKDPKGDEYINFRKDRE